MTNYKLITRISLSVFIASFLSSCASNTTEGFTPGDSYLLSKKSGNNAQEKNDVSNNQEIQEAQSQQGMTYISPDNNTTVQKENTLNLSAMFSDSEVAKIATDALPINDYLHFVLGEVLGVSYIIGEKVKADNQSITLNLQKDISKQELFKLSEELLNERGYVIRYDNEIFYIHASDDNKVGNIVFGYGKNVEKVPTTSATIIQLVPFEFGMQTSLANTIQQILKVKASPDFQRNTLILQGKRSEIIRALEFVNMMDQPVFKNRHIGLYKGTYVSVETLTKELPELLKQEGISVSGIGQNDQAVSFVALEQIGTVVFFTNNKQILERVEFWAKQIDTVPTGSQLQYFIYQPQFARAADLGESVKLLIGGGADVPLGASTSAQSQNKQVSDNNERGASVAGNGDMTLVIDERANSLIFNISGDKYRQLLPLLKRLDVMPKQVILEVMIAEVKLTDNFKQGVDFLLTNQGEASKVGGFNLSSGSTGLNYVLSGADGRITFSLFQSNSNVRVLSRPTLLVRDGVMASITVGDDIPTVGETVVDDGVSTASVVYRKTGVELKVKPTINARGVVIMEIDQKISNQATGDDSVAGSPVIFERSIGTEVVAESGQTIVLGGLISENRTLNDTSVPFFSSIPLIGHLFDSTSDQGDKTELVVLVTPKVIESTSEWDSIKASFYQEYQELKINPVN